MKLENIISKLNKLAPPHLALSWDNVGLQIGDKQKEIEKVLITLTVDDTVVNRAVETGAGLIITHHPLIFKPLSAVIYSNPQHSWIKQCIKNDIALFTMHTNLDVVPDGVSDALAIAAGLDSSSLKIIKETAAEKLFKVVTFVPADHLEKVRSAMFESGAGHIGKYAQCSFSQVGEGTFKPLDGTNPFIGEIGKREAVAEHKLETIVPQQVLDGALQAMINAHPYEEVAYDVFELHQKGTRYGMGRIGVLKEVSTIGQLKEKLSARCAGYAKGTDTRIKRVALCGGSGGDLVEKAVKLSADLYVTGEMSYHDELLARAYGLPVLLMGHHASEKFVLPVIESYLKTIYDKKIEIDILD